jgi:hypothetical protein
MQWRFYGHSSLTFMGGLTIIVSPIWWGAIQVYKAE